MQPVGSVPATAPAGASRKPDPGTGGPGTGQSGQSSLWHTPHRHRPSSIRSCGSTRRPGPGSPAHPPADSPGKTRSRGGSPHRGRPGRAAVPAAPGESRRRGSRSAAGMPVPALAPEPRAAAPDERPAAATGGYTGRGEEPDAQALQLSAVAGEQSGQIRIIGPGQRDQIGWCGAREGGGAVKGERPFKRSGLRMHGNTPFLELVRANL